jgi:DNA gyrase subunit B
MAKSNEQPAKQAANGYGADSITVLKGLEAVRMRPGMYIGSTSARGLHHLVYEVVDNSIDEALAGYATRVDVTIHPDTRITVEDDGRGIPVDVHRGRGCPGVELAMTVLHAGGKFDKNTYKVSGGLHGVGVSVVNALSDAAQGVGSSATASCIHGFPPRHHARSSRRSAACRRRDTGTKVWFKPDPEIFTETTRYEWVTLANRLRELAFLNKGIQITLRDEREGDEKEETFHARGGLREFVAYLNGNKKPLHQDIVAIDTDRDDIGIELALQYNDSYADNVFSFVNNINTHEGGTHLTGFKSALTSVINRYISESSNLNKKDKETRLSGDDVREGLTAVLSVKVREPQFEGRPRRSSATRRRKARCAASCRSSCRSTCWSTRRRRTRSSTRRCPRRRRARGGAQGPRPDAQEVRARRRDLPASWRTARGPTRRSARSTSVEGDSAGGSAKQGRKRDFQAILPLRGKIINVEKAAYRQGAVERGDPDDHHRDRLGIREEFDLTKTRYHKIIIMTDADVDGAHIRTLLLTFFYRQMPELIEAGTSTSRSRPLYRVARARKSTTPTPRRSATACRAARQRRRPQHR